MSEANEPKPKTPDTTAPVWQLPDVIPAMLRVAAATPALKLGDPRANAREIAALAARAAAAGVSLLVTPELSLTGSTLGDLYHQLAHEEAVLAALADLVAASTGWPELGLVVGLPLALGAELYNAAVVIRNGCLPGATLQEQIAPRHRLVFAGGRGIRTVLEIAGLQLPVGAQIFALPLPDSPDELRFALTIGADADGPCPPMAAAATAGARVLCHLAASPAGAGRDEARRRHITGLSERLHAAVVHANAGPGESVTDFAWNGLNMIVEDGDTLAASAAWAGGCDSLILADVDLARLRSARRRDRHFTGTEMPLTRIAGSARPVRWQELRRPLNASPFVPADPAVRCDEIFAVQAHALAARLRHTGARAAVLGVSGGLDSTLALLVAVRAAEILGEPPGFVHGITMPGYGTTTGTHQNALALMEALGCTIREIPIAAAVAQHFADIGHDPEVHDVTYENSQARERTQILMDIANQTGGLVVGTGDFSELALGWCTYNGDHMSMYGVNATVPKTLMRAMIERLAELYKAGPVPRLLRDILATPVSPELLPPDADGGIGQVTEDQLGPYELHDFFLYHLLWEQMEPRRILQLAAAAFRDRPEYPPAVLARWLEVCVSRFIRQQFKRSCLPDGAAAGPLSLSPRAGLSLPSDADPAAWLADPDGS
ncbi:MAG: NAD(+) synthase [Bacillota bacterium]|nr:NAD(+) synthase [Bacillota bacterium]